MVNLLSDKEYFAPSHEVADIHSQVAPVYIYEFARRPKFTASAEWMGVPHGENVIFDFGYPQKFESIYDEADRNVSLFIMTTYANFARYGEPTPQEVSGITWERFNSTHRAYLRVDTNPKMTASFYPLRMAFWNDYYPKLAQLKFKSEKETAGGVSTGVTMATFVPVLLVPLLMF